MSESQAAPPPESLPPESPPPEIQPPKAATFSLFFFGVVAVIVAVVAVWSLALSQRRALAQERADRHEALSHGPRVRVATVSLAPGTRTVSLPGEVHAWADATLYAKVAGYLKDLRVDKGDAVRRDQPIGHIQSPEVDQQVSAAVADLSLKKLTADRDRDLVKKGYISQQDVDTASAQLQQAQAALASARAIQEYEIIRAPFDGIVTARYADPGALLPAATGSTQAAQPIVQISDLSHLRIDLYLGQDDAALVKVGDAVRITMDQRPDVVLNAAVSRLSHALDPKTRTMLAEIDLDNRKTNIYPGEFLHAMLTLRARTFPVVPTEALIMRNQKFFVAVVENERARFIPVETGQDDGQTVQIVSGLKGGETVALNASTDVEDGEPVQPITPAPTH